MRFFTVPRKGLGPDGGPPFAPDVPEGIDWVGQMSELTADFVIGIPDDQAVLLLAPAIERFPGPDLSGAVKSRGIRDAAPENWDVDPYSPSLLAPKPPEE